MTRAQPTLADWVQQVESGLGGKSYASLFWQGLDGFAVPPLATRQETAELPHRRATGLLRARHGFAIRELIACADPATANARAHRALARGADALEFTFDALGQDARDPREALADGEASDPGDDSLEGVLLPGDGGIAIHRSSDLDAALAGLPFEETGLWFSAGEVALPVLARWLQIADARGVPRGSLRGGLDIDPIARLTHRRLDFIGDDAVGAHRAAPEPVFGETIAALRLCAEECPGVRPIAIDGQAFHLAGTSQATEVGATIAAAIDIARRLAARGVDFDTLASGASLRVQVSHELLPEIAKIRALRLLWAKAAAIFGASGTASIPDVLAVTSGRFRAEDHDQRTNLVRTALASFAAAVGGADGILCTTWNEDAEDESAADLARDQVLLLREEAQLGRVADPAGGSASIEQLTHEIARSAWSRVQQIEREGGFIEAARNGLLAEMLENGERDRDRAFRTRRRALVGVSRFADPDLGGDARAEPGPDLGEVLLERHIDGLAGRDGARAQAVIDAIQSHAAERFFDHALQDGAAHATLAELATATWPPEGVVYEHRFAPVASTDGSAFEELRASAESAEERPVIALLPFGPPRQARARADFARDLFLTLGLPVRDAGSVAASVDTTSLPDCDILVLCSDDASYPDAAASVRAALGAKDIRIVLLAGPPLPDLPPGLVHGVIHRGMDVISFAEDLFREIGLQARA
jgi:methylmalonyl-CoA mutase